MQARYIAAVIIMLAVAVSGYLLIQNLKGLGPGKYNSEAAGIEFTYPNNYLLAEHREGGGARDWDVVILTEENDLPIPQNSEGPPSIVMIVFENVENQSLEDWIHGSAFSNFKLSDEKLSSTTVGGEEALAYRYSGLYESDAVVVEHSARVYFFSAGWITEEDQIRRDFQSILGSVTFKD